MNKTFILFYSNQIERKMICLTIFVIKMLTKKEDTKCIQPVALTFLFQITAFQLDGSLIVQKQFNKCMNGTLPDIASMVVSGVAIHVTKASTCPHLRLLFYARFQLACSLLKCAKAPLYKCYIYEKLSVGTGTAIHAVVCDGQTYIKKVYQEGDCLRLVSHNAKYSDNYALFDESPSIIGKTVDNFTPVEN